jgi:hypothetical protein
LRAATGSLTIARVPGHVFVVRTDVTKLACDAWLVPTDVSLSV